MLADLHIHTTASDGSDTPAEVVSKGSHLGLRAIAITDHDTMDGVPGALAAAGEIDLEVLPGVELGSDHMGKEIHILGYLIDMAREEFQDKLALFRKTRLERMHKMIYKLREQGVVVPPDLVFQGDDPGSVGRPHLARVLVKMGVVSNVSEAFDKYIGSGRPAYVPRFKISPVEAVHMVLKAGGVPVMAHPGLSRHDGIIPHLVDEGLAGLEVYHPSQSPEQSNHYLALCGKYRLLATGGSDYHGADHDHHGLIGAAGIAYEAVTELKKIASKTGQ